MGSSRAQHSIVICLLLASWIPYQGFAFGTDTNQAAFLFVNVSEASARKIPDTVFGIFFEVSFLVNKTGPTQRPIVFVCYNCNC